MLNQGTGHKSVGSSA